MIKKSIILTLLLSITISGCSDKVVSEDNTDNNIETLSVSDEEITSIIEDTADIKILRGVGRPRKNTRTLNI